MKRSLLAALLCLTLMFGVIPNGTLLNVKAVENPSVYLGGATAADENTGTVDTPVLARQNHTA